MEDVKRDAIHKEIAKRKQLLKETTLKGLKAYLEALKNIPAR